MKCYAESTIDGKIVALPCNAEKADTKIVAIRQDLAEKYGIEKLDNWSDSVSYTHLYVEILQSQSE